MNKKTAIKSIAAIFILALAVTSLSVANAVSTADKNIVSKKLLDSSYGKGLVGQLTSSVGMGDRLYEVTYADGSKQTMWIHSTFMGGLGKASIIETPGNTIWMTAGQPVPVNIRIKGVDLDLFRPPGGTTTTHRFELDDITDQYRWITTVEAPGMLINPLSYQNKVTITIPQQAAGKRIFLIKEYVKTLDGRWIPGMDSKSTDYIFTVIWTQAQQAGIATPSVTSPAITATPTNANYVPPAPGVDILVDSVPQGATVQVGGGAIGNTPVVVTMFSTDGSKSLVLSLGGYKTAMTTVSAKSENPVTVTLTPLAGTTVQATASASATTTATAGTTASATASATATGSTGNTGSSTGSVEQGNCKAGEVYDSVSKECIPLDLNSSQQKQKLTFGDGILIVMIIVAIGIAIYLKSGKDGKGSKKRKT